MTVIVQNLHHVSGIPLGGIGTGSVEIRPDGLFHEWQIFNTGPWSPQSPCAGCPQEPMRADDLLFLVRTRTPEGQPVVRFLALSPALHDLYSLSWVRSVERIRFDGRCPLARLRYEDAQLPVEIEAEVFSPFIPHNSRASGTPGFYVRFRVTNPGDAPVEVSLLGNLMNRIGAGQGGRKPRNRLLREDDLTTVALSADGTDPAHPTSGNIAFSVLGDGVTAIAGAFHSDRGMQYVHGRHPYKLLSYWIPFRDRGELPDLDAEQSPSLPAGFRAGDLSADEQRRLLADLLRHPFVHQKRERLRAAYPTLEQDDAQRAEFLDEIATNLNDPGHYGSALGEREWGLAALCRKLILAPGQSQETLYTLSWHLPNHISPTGLRLGHRYEEWFTDARESNRFLVAHADDFRRRTAVLPELLYDSSLEPVVADAVSAQLGTLVKCTWWTRDGLFGVWEGLGCCGFHTVDITYQGSFPILALFPDLQQVQMQHGARFQRADGRVHHLFTPDFSAVDADFARVDMNPQFVMLAARDYQWTGDRAYLESLWPHIVRAMESTALLDRDGDGLPDADTRRNTYDAWDFAGCPSYIASLWLGALVAAARLAREMGDAERASAWNALFERGRRAFDDLLWNGSYYVLWRDPAAGTVDESCMSDQLSGDWFAALLGWGPIARPERIRQALQSVVEHNFTPQRGLINASCPPGSRHTPATAANMQAEATWTGIEYTVAALLYAFDLPDPALALVRDIHERHLRAGQFWNHHECGSHYYRALSSWGLLLACSGFAFDAPAGEVTLAPRVATDPCVFPIAVPGCLGRFRRSKTERSVHLELRSGTLRLRTLVLPGLGLPPAARAVLNDAPLAGAVRDGERVRFETEVQLAARDRLLVR